MNVSLALSVLFSSVLEPGLDSSTVSSRSDCIVKCFYGANCNSVFYDSSSNLCHFSRNNYDGPTSSMTSAVDVVYTVVKSGNMMVVGPQSQCPLTVFTYDSSMNICYKVLEDLTTANAHRATCEGIGGHLLALTSEARDNFLGTFTQSYSDAFCFGASFDGSEWTWDSGAPYGGYLNWASGYPINNEPCARRNRGSSEWKSFECDRGQLYAICSWYLKGCTPRETFEGMKETYGEDAPSYDIVKHWHRQFKCGRTSVEMAPIP